MIGYKLFLTEFYYIIKMKIKIYNIGLITYNAYHILVVLFLGTFRIIIKTFQDYNKNKNENKSENKNDNKNDGEDENTNDNKNNIYYYLLGFILGLIFLPLHIIINPILLFIVIKKYKKLKKKTIKLLKEYIYDIDIYFV